MKEKKRWSHAEQIALQIDSILAILHKWGIHTLGELARLDKEELRARLFHDDAASPMATAQRLRNLERRWRGAEARLRRARTGSFNERRGGE